MFLAFNCCGHGAASVRPTFAERFLDYYFPVRKTRICFEPFYVLNVVLIFYQDGLGCLNVGIRWKGDAFLQGMTLLGFSEMYHGARRYLICDGSDPASGSCATVILMPEQVREVR